jgi:hypothetical protein
MEKNESVHTPHHGEVEYFPFEIHEQGLGKSIFIKVKSKQ